jgi:tripartite-type tricarboxylate transporter receptor subunit TctC
VDNVELPVPSAWRRVRRACSAVMLACTLAAGTSAALAQQSVIHLVVPYPPGGPVDLIARIVGNKVTEEGGPTVVVENRGGANGEIGVGAVARATPDGQTLVMASTSTHSINPLLNRKVPYDATRDFAPVILLDTRPYILVVHPSLGVSTVRELIDLAKSKPGVLTYASGGGVGSGNYLAGELFKTSAGVDILHVPYQGGGPALTAVLGNQVGIFFAPIPTVLPQIQSGKLKALAVTGAQRSTVLPEVPTMAQAGLNGFEFSIWDAVLAPANTPAAVIDALHAKFAAAMASPEVKQKFIALGADPTTSTPAALAAYMKADSQRWAKVLKASGAAVN